VFCIGFVGGACITGFVCPSWTSGCPDCCHWATRTRWSCVCCWTSAVDSTNQGPAGGVNHRKSDSAVDVILQRDAILVLVIDASIGTCTASEAWGWSLSCLCQHKGELCWSLSDWSRHGWLRQMRVVHRRKFSPPGCPRKSLWRIHNHSQHPFVAWSSEGWYWGG